MACISLSAKNEEIDMKLNYVLCEMSLILLVKNKTIEMKRKGSPLTMKKVKARR